MKPLTPIPRTSSFEQTVEQKLGAVQLGASGHAGYIEKFTADILEDLGRRQEGQDETINLVWCIYELNDSND